MQVIESIHELLVNFPCIILSHSPIGLALQEPMSGSSRHILKHKYDLFLSLNSLIEYSNMRMVESLHEPDLPPDALLPLYVLDPLLLVDLQCHLLVQFLVHAYLHHGVGALADLLPDDVV